MMGLAILLPIRQQTIQKNFSPLWMKLLHYKYHPRLFQQQNNPTSQTLIKL